jgi:copper chaperone
MKHPILLGSLIPALLVLLAGAPTFLAAPPFNTGAKTTLTIKGMTCGGCVATVKLKLKKTKGIVAYDVSLEKGEADVTYDPAATDPGAIAASVSESGFKATVKAKTDPGSEKDRDDETSVNGS